MIGKVTTGTNFKGLLEYLFKEDAQIIDKSVFSEDVNGITKEFMMISELNKKVEKPVKHFVLSFSKDDENKINNEILKDIGSQYLKTMGYGNNQFISLRHNDTDKIHFHIAVNRVDMNLKGVSDSFEKRKSRDICKSLEKQYDLTITAEAGKGIESKSIGEIHQDKRLDSDQLFTQDGSGNNIGFSEEGIKQFSRLVYGTLKSEGVKSFDDLKDKLVDKGIGMSFKNGDKTIVFSKDEVYINGGDLYKKLSMHHIKSELRKNTLVDLKKNIKEVAKTNQKGRIEFFDNLKAQGIEIKMNPAKTGYSFLVDGHSFKASDVDRKFTLSRLDDTLNDYLQKSTRKYVGDTFYQFMKKDSVTDFKDYFKDKGIVVNLNESGESKFLFEGVVVNEKDLGGKVAKHGLDKVLLMKEIQSLSKKLIDEKVDHRTFASDMSHVANVSCDDKGNKVFTKDEININDSELIGNNLTDQLDRNTVRNVITEALDCSDNMDEFKEYLETQGVEVSSDGDKFSYSFEGRTVGLGIESFIDHIESQFANFTPNQQDSSANIRKPRGNEKGEESDREEDEIRRRNQGYQM
jgi:hypothetical protein